jgi:hypothetical protein
LGRQTARKKQTPGLPDYTSEYFPGARRAPIKSLIRQPLSRQNAETKQSIKEKSVNPEKEEEAAANEHSYQSGCDSFVHADGAAIAVDIIAWGMRRSCCCSCILGERCKTL